MDKIAKRAYVVHRNSARQRGIEFLMTFEEWWGVWSDYFHLRGRGTNGLCMARENDEGPYAVGNVYLTTNLGNLQDASRSPKAQARRAQRYANAKRPLWGRKDYQRNPQADAVQAKPDWDSRIERFNNTIVD